MANIYVASSWRPPYYYPEDGYAASRLRTTPT